MSTESCPCLQLPALVCKPWNVTCLFDSGISWKTSSGLITPSVSDHFSVYFRHTYLHIAVCVTLTWYVMQGRLGQIATAPGIPAPLRVAGRELWKVCMEQSSGPSSAQARDGCRFPRTQLQPHRG